MCAFESEGVQMWCECDIDTKSTTLGAETFTGINFRELAFLKTFAE